MTHCRDLGKLPQHKRWYPLEGLLGLFGPNTSAVEGFGVSRETQGDTPVLPWPDVGSLSAQIWKYIVGPVAKLAAAPGLFWRFHCHYLFPFFSPTPPPQLCHDIQRTGAHDPGRKHTRGLEVVQQQPRPRDAYELACLWGTASNLWSLLNTFITVSFNVVVFFTPICRNTTQTRPVPLQRRRNQTEPHPLRAPTMWLHLVIVAG